MMLGQGQIEEQRKNKRYPIAVESYAIIRQQNYSEVAQLVDISNSGISFLCVSEGDWDKEPFVIDLSGSERAVGGASPYTALKNIPLFPLAYCRDNCANHNPSNFMRKCGVRFGKLTLEQKIKLNEFISKNTLVVNQ